MSNWQYANYTPIQQFRSANALPRELSLYTGEDKQLYLSAAPVKETEHLRKDSKSWMIYSKWREAFRNTF